MDDYCEVTFEGDQGGTYYVSESQVKYINGSNMVNTSNSTIYLYKNIQSGSGQYTLSIPAFSYPRYSSNNTYYYITNAHNITFNNRSNFIRNFDVVEVCLLTLLACICFIKLMVRRGH